MDSLDSPRGDGPPPDELRPAARSRAAGPPRDGGSPGGPASPGEAPRSGPASVAPAPASRPLRVGELARRTGLTVRTLHHYDAVGLLRPARRTRAGHRLYGVVELRRLQCIVSLRQLGLSLEEIRGWLDRSADPLPEVLERHAARARERLAEQERLVARLEALLERVRGGGEPGIEDLIETVEVTLMYERYYSPEQLERLARRREALGEEAMEAVHRRWAELTERVRAAMDGGVAPGSPEGRALGAEWKALTDETVAGFTGGDADIRESLDRLWREQPDVGERWGMDPDLVAWTREASGHGAP